MAVASLPSTSAQTAQFEFSVSGMTCAACAARVQSRLNKVPGVSAAVNFASERAVVLAPVSVRLRRFPGSAVPEVTGGS